jgi:hypothetical protein
MELNRRSILLSTTNKMQQYTIFFIIVNALHVSGGYSAHYQELSNCIHSIWYVPGLLAATASMVVFYTHLCLGVRSDLSQSGFLPPEHCRRISSHSSIQYV